MIKEKIMLNKKIYDAKKVSETILLYKDFCKIEKTDEKDHLTLEISFDKKNYFPGEITNYLISIGKD